MDSNVQKIEYETRLFAEAKRFRIWHRILTIAPFLVSATAFIFLFIRKPFKGSWDFPNRAEYLEHLSARNEQQFVLLASVATIAILFAISFGVYTFSSNRLKVLLKEASSLEHVGLLSELAAEGQQLRGRAEVVLCRLLPDIDLETGKKLTPYQRHCLYGLLLRQREILFRPPSIGVFPKVLLAAIHRIAGSEAIPYVESFAIAKRKDKSPESQQMADYARSVLADVRIRVAMEIIDKKINELNAGKEKAEFHLEHMSASYAEVDDELDVVRET